MENKILDKVIAGDVHAFRYFVHKYQGMSFAIAVGILNDPVEAEEVVQDAFMKAFKGLKKFRRKAKFSTWLHQIVYRESLRRVKKKKLRHIDIDISEISDHYFPKIDEDILQLELDEQKKVIQHILQKLKPKERLVLQLFYLHEKSMQEIVEFSDLSLSNVKVILHRARKHFYVLLNESQQKELFLNP
jgi:RNA polymerase sigma-70 factor (ECF subfamily)